MAALKKVLYHNDAPRIPSELFVLSENADGTVNLSRDGKEAIVTNCPMSDVAKPGHATAFKPSKAKPADDVDEDEGDEGDEETPAQKKAAAAKAAADKAKAEADAKK